MRCEDFEVRLNEVLDERRSLTSDPELAEHARRCGGCGTLARGYEEMLAGLPRELPPAPAWLAEHAVQEALLKTPRAYSWPRRVERLPLFALAASVLIAAGVIWWNGSRQPPPNRLASDDTAPTVGMNTVAVGTEELKTDDATRVLPGANWAPAGAEWAQEVADGLSPVTRPTVGAISGFLNLWGISDEGHQS